MWSGDASFTRERRVDAAVCFFCYSMHVKRNAPLICIGLFTAIAPTTALFLAVNVYFFVPLVVGLLSIAVGCIQLRESTRRLATLVGLILCFGAAAGPFALTVYANRSGKPIKIVLTVGFRGEFSIVKDGTRGEDLKLEDGVWIFEIPSSGVLTVNDDHPFYRWHQANYVYADGSSAIVESLGVTAGTIETGDGSSRGSTDYDGTTHRWRVVESR